VRLEDYSVRIAMNPFEEKVCIETSSEKILIPWMKSRGWVFGEHYPKFDTRGDYPITRDGITKNIELKAEQKTTGNLFVEWASNANVGRQRWGWYYTLRADILLYHFLDENTVHVIDVKRLQECELWRHKTAAATIEQHNLTLGWLVPVEYLRAMSGITHTHQLG